MITVKKQEMSPLENKQKELNERSFSNVLIYLKPYLLKKYA